MTIKDEYEYLKTELMVKLTDVTNICNLDCPFGVQFTQEEEKKYLPKTSKARVLAKKAFIILDNTYKKVRLYPVDEFIDIFVEAVNDTLSDFKRNVMEAYLEEQSRFAEKDYIEYDKYIDSLIEKIKSATEPYVKQLKELTPADIEREIAMKDKVKKAEDDSLIKIDETNPKGLF